MNLKRGPVFIGLLLASLGGLALTTPAAAAPVAAKLNIGESNGEARE